MNGECWERETHGLKFWFNQSDPLHFTDSNDHFHNELTNILIFESLFPNLLFLILYLCWSNEWVKQFFCFLVLNALVTILNLLAKLKERLLHFFFT